MTNYLRSRFDKDKIYLMGHSGGTFIGIQAAARAPELYDAYIGQAQMVDQLKSEEPGLRVYAGQQFKANGNSADGPTSWKPTPVTLTGGTPAGYRAVRDVAMHSLGIGTTHDMNSVITGIFLPSWTSRDYTMAEKVNLWRGKAASRHCQCIWDTMTKTDLSEQVTGVGHSNLFLSGVYDYTCPIRWQKSILKKSKRRSKGFTPLTSRLTAPCSKNRKEWIKSCGRMSWQG